MPYGTKFDQKSEWLEHEDVKIGGKWFYRVGILKDADGVKKVRLAKCELKDDGKVSEVQKVNFKRRSDFDPLIPVLQRMLDKIEGQNPLGKGIFRRSPLSGEQGKYQG